MRARGTCIRSESTSQQVYFGLAGPLLRVDELSKRSNKGVQCCPILRAAEEFFSAAVFPFCSQTFAPPEQRFSGFRLPASLLLVHKHAEWTVERSGRARTDVALVLLLT